jgi:hypothetical protein
MEGRLPQLFVREGNRVVEAPEEDRIVAAGYAEWEPKGSAVAGRRVTVMTAGSTYAVDDEVRVIHVMEALEPDVAIYVVGPKEVVGESVDGELRTTAAVPGVDPLEPTTYDGPVLAGPGVDFNWEITSYRFGEPGRHVIVWEPGELRSNELTIDVV